MLHYRKLFYFDIETASAHGSFDEFVDNDKIGSSTFASKYTRMREKGNNQWSGTIDEAYLANAPLLAEYGIILCISYGIFNGDTFKVGSKTISDYKSERDFMEHKDSVQPIIG